MFVREFEEAVGPAVSIPDTVKEVFQLIFTNSIVDYIVQETNRYARAIMGEARYEKWETVKSNDIFAYCGIMIMMGLVHVPSLHDYWKRDALYYCPPIADRMSRDRFLEIHKYIHFVNNDNVTRPGDPQYDRLCKVRPVLEMIEQRFTDVYHPSRECAIDEAMVPYKGRSSLKQYMPNKPVKRGLKVWMRSDSNNGCLTISSLCGESGIIRDRTGSKGGQRSHKKPQRQELHCIL